MTELLSFRAKPEAKSRNLVEQPVSNVARDPSTSLELTEKRASTPGF
jgi:hypothetical protein